MAKLNNTESRTSIAIKNIKYSLLSHVTLLVFTFLTRMIFVRVLSQEYLGMHGLFTNVLTVLSLAELGIGVAIIYSLYEPIEKQDKNKIQILMKLYKKSYYFIGIFIFCIGIVLMPFIKHLFKDLPNIQFLKMYYFFYVLSSASTYLFSYKRVFLIANQKKYIDSLYSVIFGVLKSISQITVLILTKNFLFYLLLQIICNFVENFAVSYHTNKMYPFLKMENKNKLSTSESEEIKKNVKAVVNHKFGNVALNATDNILISKFVGLVEVGIYSNYVLITVTLQQALQIFFQAITPTIGNIGVTENVEKKEAIFKRIDLLTFWVYSMTTLLLVIFLNPAMKVWLGKNYLFSNYTVMIIILNFYIMGKRQSVNVFKDALGLFWYDRYKPIVEAILNILFSLAFLRLWGISGVIWGTIASALLFGFWIEIKVLYNHGFEQSAFKYYYYYLQQVLILLSSIMLYRIIIYLGVFPSAFIKLLITSLIVFIYYNLMIVLAFGKTDEYKYLIQLIKKYFDNYVNMIKKAKK